MKKTEEKRKTGGYTLLELVVVLSILVILMIIMVPKAQSLLQSAKRAAVLEEAQITADAVSWYLEEKQSQGKLKTKDIFPLIGLELDRTGNVLESYMGPGQAGARIESVVVDIPAGRLKQLTYYCAPIRVRLTWDEKGDLEIEYPSQEL